MVVEVEEMRLLVELCYAVRGFEKAATDDLFGRRETLPCDQFLEWADLCQIRLLVPLDMLFHALLQPQRDVYVLPGYDWTGRCMPFVLLLDFRLFELFASG
jgi:hypothetical protein